MINHAVVGSGNDPIHTFSENLKRLFRVAAEEIRTDRDRVWTAAKTFLEPRVGLGTYPFAIDAGKELHAQQWPARVTTVLECRRIARVKRKRPTSAHPVLKEVGEKLRG